MFIQGSTRYGLEAEADVQGFGSPGRAGCVVGKRGNILGSEVQAEMVGGG